MRRVLVLFALLVLLPATTTPAATGPPHHGLADLVRAADAVYAGVITARRADWSPDGKQILTYYVLEVGETLKGPPLQQFAFTELGGEVGPIGQAVPGTPVYRVGDEVVIFTHAESGRVMTLWWTEGRLPIVRGARGEPLVQVPGAFAPLPYATFREQVRRLAREDGR